MLIVDTIPGSRPAGRLNAGGALAMASRDLVAPVGFVPLTLPVSGAAPLHLVARPVVDGTSWSLSAPVWHEVAIHEREQGDFVVVIKTLRKAETEADTVRAEIHRTREAAVQQLLEFDAASELTADLDPSDRTQCTAELMMRAVSLRQKTEIVRRQYAAMLGDVLFRLEFRK